MRWEMRTRLFLRTTEFLWQEGHTCHETEEDAEKETLQMLEVYRTFAEDYMAMPVLTGRKTESEKFAGALRTYSIEAMMQDKKALQAGTSHNLGQNFAKAFDTTFQGRDGQHQRELCHTTSWGVSTQLIGALIMAHGDATGLVVPPRLAPHQVVIIAVKDDEATITAVMRLHEEALASGLRSKMDLRTDQGLGRRITDWELKGVPLRVEVGPRDLQGGVVGIVRRDTGEKVLYVVDSCIATLTELVEIVHDEMYAEAKRRVADRTAEVTTLGDALEAARTGWARLPWQALGVNGERGLNEQAVSVRCLQRDDGSIPDSSDDDVGLFAVVGRSY